MACRMALPFWPTSLDCLSWSADNYLAVAGGDSIAILTPRLGEPGPNNTHWNLCIIVANAFSAQEVPLLDPTSFANFSVGEELSLRHVHALSWSPPGLAKHRRCALAVLSSNHVLSIWECVGKSSVASDWKRMCIVNNALRKYYDNFQSANVETAQDEKASAERHEQQHVKQRICAFAWSPPIYKEWIEGDLNLTTNLGWGRHFLTVSTEDGKIVLLRVHSPHDVLAPDVIDWQVQVTALFDVSAVIIDTFGRDAQQTEDHNQPCRNEIFNIGHLTWGSQRREPQDTTTNLSFVSYGRLFSAELNVDEYSTPMEAGAHARLRWRHMISSTPDITGPLRTSPSTNQLIAFSPDTILSFRIRDNLVDSDTVISHNLDGRWDEVSGVAFCSNRMGLLQAHIVSHLSSASAHTSVLDLPSLIMSDQRQTSWQAAINECKATFGAEHELGNHVQERTWGIAASPLGDYIATCTSMHPSDAIAYVISSEQQCVISITQIGNAAIDSIFPNPSGTSNSGSVSAESVLFSTQRHLERFEQDRNGEKPIQSQLAGQIALFVEAPLSQRYLHNDQSLSELNTSDEIVRHMKYHIYLRPESVESRCDLLAAIALKNAVHARKSDSRIVLPRLVSTVLRLPEQSYGDSEMSSSILNLFKRARAKFEPLLRVEDETDAESWTEQCSICSRALPFQSVKWARCAIGHQYARCGFTLLAIQEPGLAKSCTICGTPHLNETALSSFKAHSKDDSEVNKVSDSRDLQPSHDDEGQIADSQRTVTAVEPPESLARLLFAACDKCIYCGGKFTT